MTVQATPRDAEQQAAPDAGPSPWRAALVHCARVYLAVRLGLFLVGLLATGLLPRNEPVDVPGWPATDPSRPWHHVFTAWERQDALWFLRIASEGYRTDDGSAAFFPLYPLLVRSVGGLLGGHWLLGAYVVSNLALLGALVVLYRLTETELSTAAARRTVLYVCVFPTGFFLFAPYTESLFLLLSVGCLYAARRHLWPLAAGLGALASLTRSAGVLLALPLAVEAVLQLRASTGPLRPRLARLGGALLAAAAAPLGTGAYLLWWERFGGDWRRPLDVQRETWQREPSLPWDTLVAGAHEGTRYLGAYPGGYHTVDLVVVAVLLAAGVWVALRTRATWVVWTWVSVLLPLTLVFAGRPLLSLPRFYLVVFPLFWALARFADRWRAHDLVVAVSAAGLGLLSVLFVDWYFIF